MRLRAFGYFRLAVFSLSLGWSLLGTRFAAADVDVTECGQHIPRRETGVLQQDLVCPGGTGVTMERATLDLNGHSITMQGAAGGVYCFGPRCTVTNSSASPSAIACDSSCQPTSGIGVLIEGVGARIENVTVTGFGGSGIVYQRRGRLKLENVTLTGNREGIYATRLLASGLTVVDNLHNGVSGKAMRLEGSTITGNGVDLKSVRRPRLSGTTCGTSQRSTENGQGFGTWAVCSGD